MRSLIETYGSEAEIVARARTYVQICDREESARRRLPITHDQLYSLGVVEHNRGNFEGAIACFRETLQKHRAADYIYYSLAASLAMRGHAAQALENLKKAIELDEQNRIYAKNDSDFAPLHNNKEFTDLVGMSPPSAANMSVP